MTPLIISRWCWYKSNYLRIGLLLIVTRRESEYFFLLFVWLSLFQLSLCSSFFIILVVIWVFSAIQVISGGSRFNDKFYSYFGSKLQWCQIYGESIIAVKFFWGSIYIYILVCVYIYHFFILTSQKNFFFFLKSKISLKKQKGQTHVHRKCIIDLPKLNAKNINQGNQGKQHKNTTPKHLSTQMSCGLKLQVMNWSFSALKAEHSSPSIDPT